MFDPGKENFRVEQELVVKNTTAFFSLGPESNLWVGSQIGLRVRSADSGPVRRDNSCPTQLGSIIDDAKKFARA